MKQFLSTHRALLLRIAVLLACIVIIGLIWHGSTRPPKIIQLDPITKVIEVPVDKITEKTVTKYVQEKKFPEKGKKAIGAATPILMPMLPASTS